VPPAFVAPLVPGESLGGPRLADKYLRRITTLGLVSSLVLLSTLFLKIPTATGYIHLGDGVIYGASLALGPAIGAISGAVGSGLADVLGGYAYWAPWTFVIKGMAGLIVGLVGYSQGKIRRFLGAIMAAILTIAGYALGTSILYSPEAVLGEVFGNIVQTGSGVLVGLFLEPVLSKILDKRD
jgi:uncharacterized membrane protein